MSKLKRISPREMEVRYAIGGVDGPRILQQYIDGKWGNVPAATSDCLKPKFPPSLTGLKCAGIAMDFDGVWYIYSVKPRRDRNSWIMIDSEGVCGISDELQEWLVPDLPKIPNKMWKHSWIPHPNFREDEDAEVTDDEGRAGGSCGDSDGGSDYDSDEE